MTARDAEVVPHSELQEKVSDTWDYHETLEQRKQEATKEEDEIGAAYLSGQQSALVHMVDVLEGLMEEQDDEN